MQPEIKMDMYDGVAVLVIANHLDSEVPYRTVSGVLSHEGWVDLVQTIRHVYPAAFLAMCAPHQKEIAQAMERVGLTDQEVTP